MLLQLVETMFQQSVFTVEGNNCVHMTNSIFYFYSSQIWQLEFFQHYLRKLQWHWLEQNKWEFKGLICTSNFILSMIIIDIVVQVHSQMLIYYHTDCEYQCFLPHVAIPYWIRRKCCFPITVFLVLNIIKMCQLQQGE